VRDFVNVHTVPILAQNSGDATGLLDTKVEHQSEYLTAKLMNSKLIFLPLCTTKTVSVCCTEIALSD